MPLGLGNADPSKRLSSFLSEIIAWDIDARLPGLLGGNSVQSEDTKLYSFCEKLHTDMMAVWDSDCTCLNREHLENLARGRCVHEEIADLTMGVLCSLLGADYLDSGGKLHIGGDHPIVGWRLKDQKAAAANKTLVLSCTYSAMVARGEPFFVDKWLKNRTLDPYSWVLWPKAANKHYTTVRMQLTTKPDKTCHRVEVQLADYNPNPTAKPALDEQYLACLKIAASQLFPGSAFKQAPGLKLPPQDSFNDCFFHTALFQANAINPFKGQDGQTNLRPHPNDWRRDAARLRSYVLFIFYC